MNVEKFDKLPSIESLIWHFFPILERIAPGHLITISLNFFLINANVYASGFTGAAQLASSAFADFLGFQLSTGIILLLLNFE